MLTKEEREELARWCDRKAEELHTDAGADWQEGGNGRASWEAGNRYLAIASHLRLTTTTPTESVPPRAYQAGRMLWQRYPFTDDWHGEYLVDGVRRERRVATDDEAAILALLDEAAILASRTTTTPSAPATKEQHRRCTSWATGKRVVRCECGDSWPCSQQPTGSDEHTRRGRPHGP